MHTIALLADTHGLLAPRVFPTLAAAEATHVLHAGDIGRGNKAAERDRHDTCSWLAALREVVPVDAVRGNTDDNHEHCLPAIFMHEVGAFRFIVHHGDSNPAWKDRDAVLKALKPEGGWRRAGDVIVYGHSHVPRFERHATGVYFINPGTAGGKSETCRFGKRFPQQLAIVRCCDTAFDVSAVDLQTGQEYAWAMGAPSPCPVATWTLSEPSPYTAATKPATSAASGVVTAAASRKRAMQPATAGMSAMSGGGQRASSRRRA